MSSLADLFLLFIAPAIALCLALIGFETRGENILGWFLLLFGIVYPVGVLNYYFIHRMPFWKSSAGDKIHIEEKKDNSIWAILPGLLVVFIASPLEWIYLPAFLPRATSLQIAGLILTLVSVVLLIWARANIRGFYFGHAQMSSTNKLVQSGLYHFIRHPGYTSLVLMTLGLAIGYSSLIGLVAVLILIMPGLVYSMMVKERLQSEKFGEEYRVYKSRTKRLIPYLW